MDVFGGRGLKTSMCIGLDVGEERGRERNGHPSEHLAHTTEGVTRIEDYDKGGLYIATCGQGPLGPRDPGGCGRCMYPVV